VTEARNPGSPRTGRRGTVTKPTRDVRRNDTRGPERRSTLTSMPVPESHDRYTALLASSGSSEAFVAGTTIFAEGDPGDRMFVVKSGRVALTANGRELTTLGTGDLLGEMAVIDREPRSATAVASSDCELVAIDKRRFWFLVQETPYFAELVMRVMVDRLRRQSS